MGKSFLYFGIIFLNILCFCQNIQSRDIKLLVLIIASDDLPVYVELQKIWSSYMHYDRTKVETYFMKCNPNLHTNCVVEDEIIWTRSHETIIPGMLNKTIQTLEDLMPRIKQEFDYVLRTNLSSFYIFPRLLQFLEHCPTQSFYCGTNIGTEGIGSGCGFLISPDVAELLVQNKNQFWDNISEGDDVIIGKFLKSKGIRLIPHGRMDFHALDHWYRQKDYIPANLFHFRIKNPEHLRLNDDIFIQSQLLQMFYPEQIVLANA